MPNLDYNGTATFTFQAWDLSSGLVNGADGGTADATVNGLATAFSTTSATATVTVNFVNDQPTLTAVSPPAVMQNSGAHTLASWATFNPGRGANESAQTVLQYLVTNVSVPGLFTALPAVAANGTLTYTLANNASGVATFRVQVQDSGGTANGGLDTSAAQTFTLTVGFVNQPPSFSASPPPAVNANSGPVSLASWATYTPGAGSNAAGEALLAYNVLGVSNQALFTAGGQPAVSTTGALTYTPAQNASGTSTFTVDAQDAGGTAFGGNDTSAPQTFTITVNFVNQAPRLTASNPPPVLENSGPASVSNWATFTPFVSSETLLGYTITSVATPALFSVQPSVSTTGTLTYTPAANASGTSTFAVSARESGGTANGGSDTSTPAVFTITITFVNAPPSFTAANPPAVNENSGTASVANWASYNPGAGTNVVGESILQYHVLGVGNTSLFTAGGKPAISSTGALTYTPAVNALGTSTFTVDVQDRGGTANGTDTSAAQTFTITVNPVVDQPSFTASNPPALNENAGARSIANWASFSPGPNPAKAGAAVLAYTVSNISNPGLFSVAPAVANNGTLTYTLNNDVSGTASYAVKVQDNGGTANGSLDTSVTQTFTVTVNFVNDQPSFTAANPPAVNQYAGAQAIGHWVSSFNPGPGANEQGQTALQYLVTGVSSPASFTVQPAISSTGTLTYTLASSASGPITFGVQVQDSGGTANGGIDTSAVQTFTLNVNVVADQPSFTASNPPAVNQNSAAQTISNWAVFSPGPNPAKSGATVIAYTVSNVSNPGLFSAGPAVDAAGKLTYTPAAGVSGSATFNVTVQDNGGTGGGALDTSLAQTFTITLIAPPIGNQTVSYLQGSLNIPISAANGYSVRQAGSQAWFLLQDNGLFFAGGYYQNSSGVGAQEKWMKGNTNQFGNIWYYILPNGQFYAWNNRAAGLAGALLGTLDPIYYAFPSMLHDASQEYYAYAIESKLGLYVAGPNSNLYYENFNGLGERWLLSSSNVWYYLTPDGRFWTGGGTFLASLDEMYYNEPSRLVNALSNPLISGLNQSPPAMASSSVLSVNFTAVNHFVGQWVIELTIVNVGPTSTKSKFTVTATNTLPVLSPIANPPTLHNPGTGPNTQTVTVSVSDADSGDTVIVTATGGTQGYALQRIYNLRSAGSFYTNSGGSGEKWIKGNLNQFNNPWYFIKPDLSFWAWSGGSGANGAQLAQLDQRLYYENPAFLYQGQALDLASAMQQQLGLHVVLSQTNAYGRGEKWLQDANKAWYFILPDGTFYKWSGIANSATGTLWATFDPDYSVNVATRFATTLPQYTVQANPGNSVSITPLAGGSGPNYVGDIWVLVGATDDSTNNLNRRFSYQYFKTTVVP